MEDNFLKLTNIVYKALEFFPEADPLKNRAKDKALAIMESLVLIYETSGWASFQKEKIKVQISEDVDILLGYLWIGKSQGWLNSVNYLIVSTEYEKIKKEVAPILEPTINPSNPVLNNTEPKAPNFSISNKQNLPSVKLTVRQEQIVEFLEKNNKAQVMDLQTVLPNVTKRTIRRDLDELLKVGQIIRMGDFNQVFYKMAGRTM